jgi:putative transcriptional regulator
MAKDNFLEGKVLIAMPGMQDTRFENALVFMCAHSATGAMGIIVNKVAPMMFFSDLVEQLKIVPAAAIGDLPPSMLSLPVLYGGPVEPFRGFVLHSMDYFSEHTSLPIKDGIALTATVEILQAIANGEGPARVALALGYSGWVAGQLEDEIQRNGWLHCDADDELLFGALQEQKYARAMAKIGVDPLMLSLDAGHA